MDKTETNKKLIIFDFDGVLVNTLDLSFSIQQQHNPELTKEYFHALNHGNFLENYYKEVEKGNLVDVPNWEEAYLEGLLNLNSHDLIHKLITGLKDEYLLAIVSSTMSSHIDTFLRQEKIRDFFADISGTDVHQSKVVKINSLLAKHAISPADTLFITDTLGDIREGNRCSVSSVGVTWGAHDRETLLEGKPFDVVDDVMSLELSIHKFFTTK